MFPYIAIPSYNRSDTIGQKTLKFLHLSGYPPSRIHIFVADDDEFKKYTDALDEDLYDEIIVGVKGLKDQRNFITSFYKEDEVIIQMDDDVKGIRCQMTFLQLVDLGLSSLEYRTAGLWGVMPNDDARRFKDATTKHLTHILGSFFMMRNHKNIQITHTEKEDMERSILYFRRYGQILRYQNAGVCTTYGKGTGGLQSDKDRSNNIKAGIQNLITLYPDCCKIVDKKGIQDIVLNWRAAPQTKTLHTNDDHSHLSSPT